MKQYDSYFGAAQEQQPEYSSGGYVEAQYGNGGEPSAAQGIGAAGAMSGNPYLLGASFLLNFLNEKEKQFQQKKALQSQITQNQSAGERSGLSALDNTFKSALLK